MPEYRFRCTSCEYEFNHSCKMSEREVVLQCDCPKCDTQSLKQIFTKVNFAGDPLGRQRVPMEFKERVLDRLPSTGLQKGGRRESRMNFEK